MSGSSPSTSELIARVIAREGGATITRDPDDPGGTTKYGISQRAYPHLDVAALTYEQAAAIYEQDYWTNPGIAKLGVERGEVVFDFGVNSGPGQAIRSMQRALRVTADGRLGPKTLAAACALPIKEFKIRVTLERLLFFLSTILARPTSLKYARGWFRRALELL